MYRAGKFHERKPTWAHVSLEHDSEKMKICNIEVVDEEVLTPIAEGFWKAIVVVETEEFRVYAVGSNFKDMLYVILPEQAENFGHFF